MSLPTISAIQEPSTPRTTVITSLSGASLPSTSESSLSSDSSTWASSSFQSSPAASSSSTRGDATSYEPLSETQSPDTEFVTSSSPSATSLNVPANTSARSTSVISGTSTSLAAASATGATTAGQSALQSESSLSWLTTATFAGTVAGSFILGALVAGLFVFGLLRRRSKRGHHVSENRYIPHHDNHAYGGGKTSAMSTVTTLAEPTYLSQQTEDAEARRRILSLTDQIDQHVENFYRNSKVHVDETIEAQISSYETRQMPNPLASCFEYAAHPLVLIRHCLAFHVFCQTVAPGEDTELLLPPEIAGMVGEVYHKCLSSKTSRDTISAFSLWKSLTAHLRPQSVIGRASIRVPSDAADKFAESFSRAFAAWANHRHTEDHRTNHLAALVDQAIDTGTWIFRQPDSYRFDWNTLSYNGRNSTTKMMMRETVVVPGIFKMTHMGVLLGGQGQNVVQAIVESF